MSANGEKLLFRGYGIPLTENPQRCACGGWIEAEEGRVAEAVKEHNRGTRHQGWRLIREGRR